MSDCFFKQGDWFYALADYQQAEEMLGPGCPAVRSRLAIVHNMLGRLSLQDGSEPHRDKVQVQGDPDRPDSRVGLQAFPGSS